MFLVPKYLPDGTKNGWIINRLKDKFGSRSMASGEVTYQGAVVYVVGDVDKGFKQMMEMVNLSRLSNAMRAAGIMRRALLESLVHASGRVAFGGPLIALPLLRANLMEMLLDVEAAASVVFNAAAVFDRWDKRLCRGPQALPHLDAGRQVLDDRAGPRGGERGHERARRQRLYRGVGQLAARARRLPRRHLGGRDAGGGARRPARHHA